MLTVEQAKKLKRLAPFLELPADCVGAREQHYLSLLIGAGLVEYYERPTDEDEVTQGFYRITSAGRVLVRGLLSGISE